MDAASAAPLNRDAGEHSAADASVSATVVGTANSESDAAQHEGVDASADAGRTVRDATAASDAPCKLVTFAFTTLPGSGRWSPQNTGVAWIENTSMRLVHALEYWGWIDSTNLARYRASGGPVWVGSIFVNAPPDVIAGATLSAHKAHIEMWKCTVGDAGVQPAPAGSYRAMVEFYEGSVDLPDGGVQSLTHVLEVPFELGAPPAVVTPPDSASFKDVRVTIE